MIILQPNKKNPSKTEYTLNITEFNYECDDADSNRFLTLLLLFNNRTFTLN